jgi:nicotinamide-nucleotide adenylyltransferase
MKRALFIGRFQPFHNGHLHVAKSLSKKYDDVVIGIGSSQEKNTKNNPFSYNERKAMITKTLKNNKIKNFKIYPIPDLYDDYKWTSYIIKKLPKFDAVYSGNNWTLRCLRKHKIKCRKVKLIKGINSTRIRAMIKNNKKWEKFVPEAVVEHIKNKWH